MCKRRLFPVSVWDVDIGLGLLGLLEGLSELSVGLDIAIVMGLRYSKVYCRVGIRGSE